MVRWDYSRKLIIRLYFMKVYCAPTGLHSRAMIRVKNALIKYKPSNIQIVDNISSSDLLILHVIGFDSLEYSKQLQQQGKMYSVIQYCMRMTDYTIESHWWSLWQNAKLVWSYYNLDNIEGKFNFYHAPLGIDETFINHKLDKSYKRENLVITTGFVSGIDSEPIEEVWQAATKLNYNIIHIGPNKIEGIDFRTTKFNSYVGFPGFVNDIELSYYYSRAKYVSGLRHVEGLELPAAEALSCGSRPLVFAQDATQRWYGTLPTYLPDCHGETLLQCLADVLSRPYENVSDGEIKQIKDVFNWEKIITEYWQKLLATI